MVFQDYALYPHMSVRDNLAFGLKLRRLPRAQISAGGCRGGDVGSDGLHSRRPGALSGGQRQRVAIGRAMVREPALSDGRAALEPRRQAAGEDARRARTLHQRLGVTTVYVTHDQTEAMTLGQRVAVCATGAAAVRYPPGLYDRPVNMFVAAFIGSPAMNLVQAEIADTTARFAGSRLRCHRTRPWPADAIGDPRVRPTDFELPTTESTLPRIAITPEVVESLGAESNVIFPVDAPRIDSTPSAPPPRETKARSSIEMSGRCSRPESRPHPVAASRTAQLVVHSESFRYFDIESGIAL